MLLHNAIFFAFDEEALVRFSSFCGAINWTVRFRLLGRL